MYLFFFCFFILLSLYLLVLLLMLLFPLIFTCVDFLFVVLFDWGNAKSTQRESNWTTTTKNVYKDNKIHREYNREHSSELGCELKHTNTTRIMAIDVWKIYLFDFRHSIRVDKRHRTERDKTTKDRARARKFYSWIKMREK